MPSVQTLPFTARAITRRAAAAFVLLSAAACNDPVTDPLDAFSRNPVPVLGRWVTVSASDDTLQANIQAGTGFLFGEFEFERTGITFELQFNGATWDGSAIRFVSDDLFDAGVDTIPWTALLVPAAGDDPTILRLFPRVGGGVPFGVEYVRPD